MPEQSTTAPILSGIVLRCAATPDELTTCFPVISLLRPGLKDAADWVERASGMAADGYRVLAAWQGTQVLAVAGYRIMENLIHGHFLYVDDLITAESQRGKGLGAALLAELSAIGKDKHCRRLVLDTGATNTDARRFYKREGLLDAIIGFYKPLGDAA